MSVCGCMCVCVCVCVWLVWFFSLQVIPWKVCHRACDEERDSFWVYFLLGCDRTAQHRVCLCAYTWAWHWCLNYCLAHTHTLHTRAAKITNISSNSSPSGSVKSCVCVLWRHHLHSTGFNSLLPPYSHRFVDVGVDTTTSDGGFDEWIRLLMASNGLLQMSWGWCVWPSDTLMQLLPTPKPLTERHRF